MILLGKGWELAPGHQHLPPVALGCVAEKLPCCYITPSMPWTCCDPQHTQLPASVWYPSAGQGQEVA